MVMFTNENFTKDSGLIAKGMETAYKRGPLAIDTKVNSKMICWKETAFIHGLMEQDMKVNIKMV